MKIYLLVAVGGAIGSCSRYMISKLIHTAPNTFPTATFIVNIVGCLCIGLAYSYFNKMNTNEEVKFFITSGILGGFTTFSAFSYESFQLFQNQHYITAITYILLSILAGILFSFIGYLLLK